MTKEYEDLATHVSLCELRYQGIQEKFNKVDARLDQIEVTLNEIKAMIVKQGDQKFKAMTAAMSTILVGVLSLLGYIVVHIK
jgi:hypothetical protein